ncbi:hypothetical protein DPM19_13115 [Actinomadura craniellae]|uniref:Uncharacterized protein n=1 Tax=Actinomadura craniellae TaxID=2231787 RepID=A0A365H6H6_9ACTN|nr:hypothetical protein [Actinomadura craniellae]RAY14687.1 hypothetical protein DPM19_13115 [Actinomadura craniellae]
MRHGISRNLIEPLLITLLAAGALALPAPPAQARTGEGAGGAAGCFSQWETADGSGRSRGAHGPTWHDHRSGRSPEGNWSHSSWCGHGPLPHYVLAVSPAFLPPAGNAGGRP